MTAKSDILTGIPLFDGLRESDRRKLIELMGHISFPKGTQICQMGDPGNAIYLVRAGKIGLWITDHTGQRIDIETCHAGQVFGELSVFDGGPRTTSAEALEHSELLILERDALLDFLKSNARAAVGMLSVVGGRNRRAYELFRGRTTRNVNTELVQRFSLLDRVALAITAFSGSMPFLLLHLTAFAAWIVVNLGVIPGISPFDPFPFGLLTMAVSLEAIFLAVFVLLSQNLQVLNEKVRSDIEYQINIKAELEVSHLHDKFDYLQHELLGRLQAIEHSVNGSSFREGAVEQRRPPSGP